MPKVLICDDSQFTRKRIIDIIRPDNYEINEAVDGNDAMQKIIDMKPDIVILDLLMPNLNGIEVLKKLRAENNSTPVIVLSADIQSTTKEECLQLGAAAFLNKPPAKEELLETINEVIKN